MGTPSSYRRPLDKKLLSHEKDNVDLNIMMVKVKKGMEVPEHVHEQDDIIYQLDGTCKMRVEGAGDFQLAPGNFIRIPAGVKHQPHEIEEDVLAFDIFVPHLFSFSNFRLLIMNTERKS